LENKEIKEAKKLTIDTFFMREEDYNVLSDSNKKIGQKYIDSIANGSKHKQPATITFNGWILRYILEHVENDLDSLTIDDIDSLISAINKWKTKTGKSVTANTKKVYYVGFKLFLFWYAKRYKKPEYRELAELIELPNNGASKKSSDMLTDKEITTMIAKANSPRNKAIIATLAESGCRIGELLACNVGDIVFTDNGCDLKIRISKTEPRIIPLGEATHYIRKYLNNEHPLRNDPAAPLWMTITEGKPRNISYHAVRSMILRLAKESGVTKHIHPHLFRHTVATALSKTFNEYELRKFFGWSEKSNTPSVYVHLKEDDIRHAVYAKRYGLMEVEEMTPGKKVGRCPQCNNLVPVEEDICGTCQFVVNQEIRDMNKAREQIIAEAIMGLDKKTMLVLQELLKTN
jgi:integrase/recombinase XerD